MAAHFLWTPIGRKSPRGSIFALLERVPIFEGLSRGDLKAIERILHIRTYVAGETIFREGDSGLGMYIVESGEVKIIAESSRTEIARFTSGDFFGEVGLFLEQPRSASAVAVSETVAWGFFLPDLLNLVETHPRLGVSVVLKLTRIVAERLNRATAENTRLTELLARAGVRDDGAR